MKQLLLPIALALLAANLGASTVDLTPRYVEIEFDGIQTRQLYFLEDSTKIGITLDQETTVTSGGGSVVFKCRDCVKRLARLGKHGGPPRYVLL